MSTPSTRLHEAVPLLLSDPAPDELVRRRRVVRVVAEALAEAAALLAGEGEGVAELVRGAGVSEKPARHVHELAVGKAPAGAAEWGTPLRYWIQRGQERTRWYVLAPRLRTACSS